MLRVELNYLKLVVAKQERKEKPLISYTTLGLLWQTIMDYCGPLPFSLSHSSLNRTHKREPTKLSLENQLRLSKIFKLNHFKF